MSDSRRRVFLLSPAHCGGKRAALILRDEARLPLAVDLRNGTATLGAVFAFVSGLYFRGKVAYVDAFAAPPLSFARVITPTRGLLPLDTRLTTDVIREFAAVDVDAADPRYREPLTRDALQVASWLGAAGEAILLGSIATDKYVEVLADSLGERLSFPSAFAGRGDMSRGALMLQAARAGCELAYVPAHAAPRSFAKARHRRGAAAV